MTITVDKSVSDPHIVTFLPDGKRLFMGGSSLTLWDIQNRTILRDFQHGAGYFGSALSPDGKRVAAGYVSSEHVFVGLFDIETGNRTCGIDYQMKELPPKYPSETNPRVSVAISPGGNILITGDSRGRLISWDTATGNMIREYNVYSNLMAIPLGQVVFLWDQRHVLVSPGGMHVELVDLDKDEIVYSVCGSPGYSLSSDLSRLLVYGDAFLLYETSTGNILRSIPAEKTPLRGVALSPDGNLAIAGSVSGDEGTYPLKVVDLRTGETLRTYPVAPGGLVGFSPDGKYFLRAENNKLLFYDISDLQAAVKEPGVENQGK